MSFYISVSLNRLDWYVWILTVSVCVCVCALLLQIQDVAEQGVMFVGFLQQPGGGPCFLGHWDPEELSSLHSSPSPIHRNPFSANTSPTDPTEPYHNDQEPDHHQSEPQKVDNNSWDLKPSVPREPDFGPLKPVQSLELDQEEFSEQSQPLQISLREPLESTNQRQDHSRPNLDTIHLCPNQNPAEAHGNQLCPSSPEAAGIIRNQKGQLPEKHFNLSDHRERKSSSSDSWLSSPELDRSHERKSSSTCTDGQSGMTTHNNNHIRLKSSERDKNSSSPPTQASK